MKPYDRLTIIRNRVRIRDLRLFRERVQDYFDQLEHGEDTGATRSAINRMLPRILEIVEAADLGRTEPRAADILHHLFSDRYRDGAHQEVLDVIDMTMGVYDANRYAALTRTVNPLFYVGAAFGFVAGLPRRALVAIGLLSPRSGKARAAELTRLEAALNRVAGTEDLIESRFAEMREWQSRLFGENADQLADMAERIDFLERVLAQQRPAPQLKPGEKKRATPQ
jgi:hypothetical protein